MKDNKTIMFVVSKSTGYLALKSFLEYKKCEEVTVVLLDDRQDIRSCFDMFIVLCKKFQVDIVVAKGKDSLRAAVSTVKPNLVFVCGWYWIIPDEVLAQVPQGFLGIHNSLLPKYRGHAPLVWSMINGDEVVGSSLFQITSGMDTGNIFHQWHVKTDGKYLTEVLSEIDSLIERDFGFVFKNIIMNSPVGSEQNHQMATFSAKRRQEDGVINWGDSANKILLKVKALSSPYPNAFTYIGNNQVFLIKAEIFEFPVFGEIGQVVYCNDDYAVIYCGNNEGVKVIEATDIKGERCMRKLFCRLSSPVKEFEKQ